MRFASALLLMLALVAGSLPAQCVAAEVSEVKIATGYGLIFLPMMLMQHDRLIEKHARAMGLGEIKVIESKLAGGGMRNDALLAGAVDFVGAGVTPLVTMW